MSVRAWVKAARPLAHANIAPPILLGVAFAYASGFTLEPWLVGAAFGFGVLDHLAIVFANDYADRDADSLSEGRTLVSGGSRVIQDGLLDAGQLRTAALAAAVALMAATTVVAVLLERPFLPALAGLALVILHAYSYPPLRLGYRGYGEIMQGVGVGLVLPLVGWYCVTGRLEHAPFEAFAPLVLLGYVSNILTALPDVEGDRLAHKNTWPVRRGEKTARRDALVLLGVGILIASQVGPALPREMIGMALAPPALAAILALRWMNPKSREDELRFVILAAGAITLLHLTWATVLFVGSRGGSSVIL